jgi:hypothetical protein
MAQLESEVAFNIAREAEGHRRQLPEQSFFVKNVSGGNITLKFIKSCFRKHFVMASKKSPATSLQAKVEHRAEKRYQISKRYRDDHDGKRHPDNKSLEKRFGDGSCDSSVVDLTAININEAMMKIALAARAKNDWNEDTSGEVLVAFGRECVCFSNVQSLKEGETANRIDTVRRNSMIFKMKKTGDGTYDVYHAK